MPNVSLGAVVRIYYDEDTFDEGEITLAQPDRIEVDFYDWIECWTSAAQFVADKSFFTGRMVLIPNTAGIIIKDFRKDGR